MTDPTSLGPKGLGVDLARNEALLRSLEGVEPAAAQPRVDDGWFDLSAWDGLEAVIARGASAGDADALVRAVVTAVADAP
jgi:hypothetical protein